MKEKFRARTTWSAILIHRESNNVTSEGGKIFGPDWSFMFRNTGGHKLLLLWTSSICPQFFVESGPKLPKSKDVLAAHLEMNRRLTLKTELGRWSHENWASKLKSLHEPAAKAATRLNQNKVAYHQPQMSRVSYSHISFQRI